MTTDTQYSQAVETAREYYDSSDADNFYYNIWGGEDIHVGIYDHEDESIFDASRRTVERMYSQLDHLDGDSRVIDLGAGYGGAARFLARRAGCDVVALNLSTVQNRRNREKNQQEDLARQIEVVDGNFEEIPYPDSSFDVVWAQDSILHSGARERVCQEVARIMSDGAEFVFTDPMKRKGCPSDILQPILERINLDSLGSPDFYRETLEQNGLELVEYTDFTEHLVNHYDRVLQETERREDELREAVSEEYITSMKEGLEYWIEGGKKNYLAWGIFHFRNA